MRSVVSRVMNEDRKKQREHPARGVGHTGCVGMALGVATDEGLLG